MTTRDSQQLSLSGLLFIVAGIAICCAVMPRLPDVGGVSPPLSPLFVIVLMFGWAMIAIRRRERRYWWVGFVGCGVLYLFATCCVGDLLIRWVGEIAWSVSEDPRLVPTVSWDRLEFYIVFGLVGFVLVSLCGVGAFGGFCVRTLYERRSCPTQITR